MATAVGTSDVSVLMPVHRGVDPRHLDLAVRSVRSQTLAPLEVVVVCDGPLSPEHDAVLAAYPDLVVVRLADNRGSAVARQAGLVRCRGTFVALADSDDISEPSRLQRQLELLETTGADVCAAAMTEFEGTSGRTLGLRGSPTEHERFATLMPLRNPVNQPATMFRRRTVVESGGYQHLPYLEDYDLWARLVRDGARFVGTDEPLVRFRADGMLKRRTSREARRAERLLQQRLRRYGLVGPVRARVNLVVRGLFLRLPKPVLALAYQWLLRSRSRRR